MQDQQQSNINVIMVMEVFYLLYDISKQFPSVN
jgi:hypothetical protein